MLLDTIILQQEYNPGGGKDEGENDIAKLIRGETIVTISICFLRCIYSPEVPE